MAATKKLIGSKSGLRAVSKDESGRSPFELSEPPWDPDSKVSQCVQCSSQFDFLRRRHHCRRCGRIFCGRCCDSREALPRMCFLDPVRLCKPCAEVTRKENEFYTKHLKILLNGANLTLKEGNSSHSIDCKLSSDHRFLLFHGDCFEPLPLTSIRSFRRLFTMDDQAAAGSNMLNGIQITYIDMEKQSQELCLLVSGMLNKNSVAWLSALQKAIKMVLEANAVSPTLHC